MKCEKCGYSLQIEDVVCPSCGTPNPFAKEHRESMAKYAEAFEDTQREVVETTRKAAGAMIKFSICVVMFFIIVVMLLVSSNPANERNAKIKKVRSNIEYYRSEYTKLEASNDYIALKTFYGYNDLNIVPEFSDCLPVFNVCMYYDYLVSYLAEITYPDYIEHEIRDYENYCESIIESYDQMIYYANMENEESEYSEGHKACMNACLEQSRILIKATFRLSDEQMEGFEELSQNGRIAILEENWPHEK